MNGILYTEIDGRWPEIQEKIETADRKADFLKWYPLEYIKQQFKDRNWQCWEDEETFFITCITVYPSGYKEIEVLLVCGNKMKLWADEALNVLKSFGRGHGCDALRAQGRAGWAKYGKNFEPDLKPEYLYRVKLCQAE